MASASSPAATPLVQAPAKWTNGGSGGGVAASTSGHSAAARPHPPSAGRTKGGGAAKQAHQERPQALALASLPRERLVLVCPCLLLLISGASSSSSSAPLVKRLCAGHNYRQSCRSGSTKGDSESHAHVLSTCDRRGPRNSCLGSRNVEVPRANFCEISIDQNENAWRS